ncbi:pimeloyl-ACP methyl esterase BioG family protein [uncultured Porphyromonas sp.]|uniref:pimeloyl-ACP methyl esterase BioG family protein n=1 Tax=uncultured Porphyromonas sp. TaxID=159274 RepID=UPI0026283FB7|nr:pimeloyl-ACP methyl esterase BioG family protein [uncultured Porphyromonas sp.]
MQYTFQRNSDQAPARQLIIYFCGWGMTPATVAHLTLPPQCDLLALYDYRILELSDDLADLPWDSYEAVTIVAWSLGVWAAEQVVPHWSILPTKQRLIAVAGSPYPMHDQWGIPKQIFVGTLEGLTDENRQRFNRRMCGGKRYKQLYDILSERPTTELRDELQAVYDSLATPEASESTPHTRLAWDLAIIGERDQIFPAKNLSTLWKAVNVPTLLLPDGYHYLFDLWQSWSELWAPIQ